ncbi:MAG: hypothetical protein K0S40_3694, partial [Actinomycetospora sp.]|nr:hypothetical protein [Actinomycetospora sp.]
LVAVALDRALTDRRWVVGGLVLLAAATWTPSNSQQSTDARVPAFFEAGAPGLSRMDVVATVPRTSGDWAGGARPMQWQAVAGMTYRQTGGYLIGSTRSRPLVLEAPPPAFDALAGDPVVARRDLDELGVTVVLVVEQPDVDLTTALRWAQQVTGVSGYTTGGVWVFRR